MMKCLPVILTTLILALLASLNFCDGVTLLHGHDVGGNGSPVLLSQTSPFLGHEIGNG